MAEEKIGYSDLFADDFVQPAIAQLETLLQTIQTLEERIKSGLKPQLADLAKTLAQFNTAQALTASGVRQVAQSANQVAKSAAQLSEVSKLKKRLQRNVEDLRKALTEEREEIKRLINEQSNLRKSLKELTREAQREAELREAIDKALKNNFESYTDLAEAYDTLANALQDFLAKGETSTEEFRKTAEALRKVEERLKAVDESVGRFQRNVGDYRRSILESLTQIAVGAGDAGQKVAGLAAIVADSAIKAFQAAGGFKNFGAAIVAVGRSLRSVGIILLLEGLLFLLQKIQEYFSTEARLRIAELEKRNEFLKVELSITTRILELQRRLGEIEGENTGNTEQRLKIQRELIKAQREQLSAQAQFLEETIKIRQKEAEIADKYDERLEKEAEVLELRKQLLEITNKDAELAAQIRKINEELLTVYARAREEALALFPQIEQAFATRADELKKTFQEQVKAIEEARQKALELVRGDPAGIELVNRRSKQLLDVATANFREARAKLLQEQLSQITQFFAQYAEVSAQYAEIAAQADFETRKAVIDQLQAELLSLDELTDERLEVLNKLRELNLAQRDATLFEVQLRNIRATIEAQKAATEFQIKQIELETAKRKQALREQVSDLEEIRRQEAEIEAETKRQIIALREAQIRDQIELEQKLLQEIEERRKQFSTDLPTPLDVIIAQTRQNIEQLFAQLADAEKAAIEASISARDRLLAYEKEQRDRILREQEEAVKKQAEEIKKQLTELQRFSQSTLDFVNKLATQASERRREALEGEARALDRTLDALIARAQAGSLQAQESIAEVLERQKEIEARQRELRRQDQRRQLLLTALQAYTGALLRGSQQPLLDTIRDLTALSQLAQALPTFYQGTEYINAKNAPKMPNIARDAYIVRVHEGERIVPAHINRQLGNVPNERLPELLNSNINFEYDKFRDALVYVVRKANKLQRKYDRL